MQRQVPCPRCGAPCYATDAGCLSCGLPLDEGRPRDVPPTPPAPHASAGPSLAPPDVSEPEPLLLPPLMLVVTLLAADVGLVRMLGVLHVGIRSYDNCSDQSGVIAVMLLYLLMGACGLLLALSVAVALGEQWARYTLGLALLPAIVIVAAAGGARQFPVVLCAISFPLLVVALALPSARRYCVRSLGQM